MGRVVQLYQQMTYPGQRIQADVEGGPPPTSTERAEIP